VEEYYTSLESRLGYWLLLGNARHCGFWEPGVLWPFPINQAQRVMEKKVHNRLNLSNGSRVLDAGAGSGIVASYMAQQGLLVQGVDITPMHVADAQHNIKKRGLEGKVTVKLGDYHDLRDFEDDSMDGIYTMETFVHADNPRKVLQNFFRLLRPDGVLVLNEADFEWDSELLQEVLRLSHCQNTLKQGAYEDLLRESGFIDLTMEDYTDNVLPLWRLFGVVGAILYEIIRLLGLQSRFANVMAGVEAYRHWGQGRYISVRAVKPATQASWNMTQAARCASFRGGSQKW
jgi:sterol 24-C-methyltransferase